MKFPKSILAATAAILVFANIATAQIGYARRIVPAAALPANCLPGNGDVVFLTAGGGSPGMYQCVATNTWAPVGLATVAEQLNITQGTLLASTPFLVHTATWNNGGITFLNATSTITDTASSEGSLLADLVVGATHVFNINKNGGISINQGARTTNNFPAFNATSTFNNGAVSFDLIDGIVTDTASAATSSLIRLGIGANNIFRVQKDGLTEFTASVAIQPQPMIAGKAQGIRIVNPGGAVAIFGDLAGAADGTIIYCSTCTIANPCSGKFRPARMA